ncbi:MAG TPA: haloalkane dehalogenase [Myxococcales bacterium]|nr:haloalkane dehalogenase [Myxococcales bacterium]
MDALRTPDERFAGLPGWPFPPRYVEVDGLRMHYVEEGKGQPVLLLHGEPSWSYLYRKMIPVLAGAGLRAIAPDLVGFGRSDKPSRRSDYSYQRHLDWMRGLLRALDLRDAILFCQDWGGLIGLRLVAEDGDRFARVVAANTFLPTGDQRVPLAFRVWRAFSQLTPVFPAGQIVRLGCAQPVDPAVRRAYDAPYPEERYKAGARQFPLLVPTRPDDPASGPNRAAWEKLKQWRKPFLTLFGGRDPIMRGAERRLQKLIPGAQGQPHAVLPDAGHFLQEDRGEELARRVVEWVKP